MPTPAPTPTPTTGSRFLDEEGKKPAQGTWLGWEVKVVNGKPYWIGQIADGQGGKTDADPSVAPIRPATELAPKNELRANIAAADEAPQLVTPEELEVATAVLDYLNKKEKYETDPAKEAVAYETAVEKLDQLRRSGRYIDRQIQSDLAKDAAQIEEARARTAKTRSDIGIQEAAAPGERRETEARGTLLGSQATGVQIDNMLKQLGTLGTYQQQRNAVGDMYEAGEITREEALAIMDRLKQGAITGVPPETTYREEAQTTRQTQAEAATLRAQREREEAQTTRQTQIDRTGAARDVLGDEASRQRQLLQSTQAQQASRATAQGNFMQWYGGLANPNAEQAGAGFLEGLSLVKGIFSDLKELANPSPLVGQSQGFLGNLLGGGAPPPAAGGTGPAMAPAANAAGPLPGDDPDLTDPLMAAAAAEDAETQLPEEADAIQRELEANHPIRAANMSVDAWKRKIGKATGVPQPTAAAGVL